jgi:hypothetical protein
MAWSHLYDLLLKIAALFAVIGLVLLVPGMADAHPALLLSMVLGGWFAAYHLVFRTLSTFLYARFTLGIPLDLSQAKALNDAFTPAWPMQRQWLPMKDLKAMDRSLRHGEALRRLAAWKGEHQAKQAAERQANAARTPANKAALAVMIAAIPLLLIASVAQLPPADRVIAFYCTAFDTDTYSPMLVWVIMLIPVLLLYGLLSRLFKWPL